MSLNRCSIADRRKMYEGRSMSVQVGEKPMSPLPVKYVQYLYQNMSKVHCLSIIHFLCIFFCFFIAERNRSISEATHQANLWTGNRRPPRSLRCHTTVIVATLWTIMELKRMQPHQPPKSNPLNRLLPQSAHPLSSVIMELYNINGILYLMFVIFRQSV